MPGVQFEERNKDGMNSLFVTKFSPLNLREGATSCLNEAVQMAYDKERPGRLIQAHTRWGKSLIVRWIAYCMNYGYIDPGTGEVVDPTSSAHVLATPGKHLVEQMLNSKKWAGNLRLFGIEAPEMKRCAIGSTSSHRQIGANGERFFAVTIQQLTELDKTSILREWISWMRHKYGLPVVFHFDEVHFNNEQKPWGELVTKVQEYGALTIGWTATPQRADNGLIAGARIRLIGQDNGIESIVKNIRTDENGERWATIEDREVAVTDYEMLPDVAITFATGWNMNYILKVDHDFVDVELSELGIDGSEENALRLSDLSSSFIRKNAILRTVVESTVFVRLAVQSALRHLRTFRTVNPTAQILVFSNSDTTASAKMDKHANLIKKIFESEAPELKVLIDTGNIDNPGKGMAAFENGECDVLIVKRMGAVGWDVPNISVVVDLSVDRTPARCMQAWMRGATVDDKYPFKLFALILPQDAPSNEIFRDQIDREGGVSTVKDVSIIGSREEKLDENQRPVFVVKDVGHGDFLDSDLNFAPREMLGTVDWFMNEFPAVKGNYSQAEIASKLGGHLSAPNGNGYTDDGRTDKKADDLRSDVASNMDEYARMVLRYDPNNQAKYAMERKMLWGQLVDRCGGISRWPKDAGGQRVELKKINDLDLLEVMKNQSAIMLEHARRNGRNRDAA